MFEARGFDGFPAFVDESTNRFLRGRCLSMMPRKNHQRRAGGKFSSSNHLSAGATFHRDRYFYRVSLFRLVSSGRSSIDALLRVYGTFDLRIKRVRYRCNFPWYPYGIFFVYKFKDCTCCSNKLAIAIQCCVQETKMKIRNVETLVFA